MSGEKVVLLDENNQPAGEMLKSEVHSDKTPYHLAFSCYIADLNGNILLSRRSLTKTAWPGTWSNSFCGHPAPAEPLEDAVARRARQELGINIYDIKPILPEFRYFARDDNNIAENEFCPVFTARSTDLLRPAAEEVMSTRWITVNSLLASVRNAPFIYSPWMVEQLHNNALIEELESYNSVNCTL